MALKTKDLVEVVSTAATVTTATATAMAGSAVATGAITSASALLTAAGVSASVPVVGWVIAGLLGATAGSILLARKIRTGKIKRADAEAEARGLKVDPGIAGYVVKALKHGPSWRADEASALIARIAKNPDRKLTRDRERLAFLTIVDLDSKAAKRGKAPVSAPIAEVERNIPAEPEGVSTGGVLVGLGVVGVIGLGLLLFAPPRK